MKFKRYDLVDTFFDSNIYRIIDYDSNYKGIGIMFIVENIKDKSIHKFCNWQLTRYSNQSS